MSAIVELDCGQVGPFARTSVESDHVIDFLRACREHSGAELNERDVGGSIRSAVVKPPNPEACTALSWLERGVEGGFGYGSPTREHNYRGEGPLDGSIAIGERYGDGPRADQTKGSPRRLPLGG